MDDDFEDWNDPRGRNTGDRNRGPRGFQPRGGPRANRPPFNPRGRFIQDGGPRFPGPRPAMDNAGPRPGLENRFGLPDNNDRFPGQNMFKQRSNFRPNAPNNDRFGAPNQRQPNPGFSGPERPKVASLMDMTFDKPPMDRGLNNQDDMDDLGPMDRGPGPISRGPGPMNQGPGPMNQGPIDPGPMNQGQGPMNQGPMNAGPGPMNRGPGPMSRDPDPMNQGPINPGPGPMSRGPDPMNRGLGPMNQGPVGRGPDPMNRGPGPMNQVPMNRGPGPMNQVPMNRGPGPLNQGPMNRGPGPMNQGLIDPGPSNMNRGPGPMNQGLIDPGPSNMNRGPGPMNQGLMDPGPGPMNRGPGPMNQVPMDPGSGPMNEGRMNVARGSMDQGLMNLGRRNSGPMDQGMMNRDPMNQGPENQGLFVSGPQNRDRGPMNPRMMNPSLMTQDAMDQHRMDSVQMNRGPPNAGPMSRDQMDRAPVNRGQMNPVSRHDDQMNRGPVNRRPMDSTRDDPPYMDDENFESSREFGRDKRGPPESMKSNRFASLFESSERSSGGYHSSSRSRQDHQFKPGPSDTSNRGPPPLQPRFSSPQLEVHSPHVPSPTAVSMNRPPPMVPNPEPLVGGRTKSDMISEINTSENPGLTAKKLLADLGRKIDLKAHKDLVADLSRTVAERTEYLLSSMMESQEKKKMDKIPSVSSQDMYDPSVPTESGDSRRKFSPMDSQPVNSPDIRIGLQRPPSGTETDMPNFNPNQPPPVLMPQVPMNPMGVGPPRGVAPPLTTMTGPLGQPRAPGPLVSQPMPGLTAAQPVPAPVPGPQMIGVQARMPGLQPVQGVPPPATLPGQPSAVMQPLPVMPRFTQPPPGISGAFDPSKPPPMLTPVGVPPPVVPTGVLAPPTMAGLVSVPTGVTAHTTPIGVASTTAPLSSPAQFVIPNQTATLAVAAAPAVPVSSGTIVLPASTSVEPTAEDVKAMYEAYGYTYDPAYEKEWNEWYEKYGAEYYAYWYGQYYQSVAATAGGTDATAVDDSNSKKKAIDESKYIINERGEKLIAPDTISTYLLKQGAQKTATGAIAAGEVIAKKVAPKASKTPVVLASTLKSDEETKAGVSKITFTISNISKMVNPLEEEDSHPPLEPEGEDDSDTFVGPLMPDGATVGSAPTNEKHKSPRREVMVLSAEDRKAAQKEAFETLTSVSEELARVKEAIFKSEQPKSKSQLLKLKELKTKFAQAKEKVLIAKGLLPAKVVQKKDEPKPETDVDVERVDEKTENQPEDGKPVQQFVNTKVIEKQPDKPAKPGQYEKRQQEKKKILAYEAGEAVSSDKDDPSDSKPLFVSLRQAQIRAAQIRAEQIKKRLQNEAGVVEDDEEKKKLPPPDEMEMKPTERLKKSRFDPDYEPKVKDSETRTVKSEDKEDREESDEDDFTKKLEEKKRKQEEQRILKEIKKEDRRRLSVEPKSFDIEEEDASPEKRRSRERSYEKSLDERASTEDEDSSLERPSSSRRIRNPRRKENRRSMDKSPDEMSVSSTDRSRRRYIRRRRDTSHSESESSSELSSESDSEVSKSISDSESVKSVEDFGPRTPEGEPEDEGIVQVSESENELMEIEKEPMRRNKLSAEEFYAQTANPVRRRSESLSEPSSLSPDEDELPGRRDREFIGSRHRRQNSERSHDSTCRSSGLQSSVQKRDALDKREGPRESRDRRRPRRDIGDPAGHIEAQDPRMKRTEKERMSERERRFQTDASATRRIKGHGTRTIILKPGAQRSTASRSPGSSRGGRSESLHSEKSQKSEKTQKSSKSVLKSDTYISKKYAKEKFRFAALPEKFDDKPKSREETGKQKVPKVGSGRKDKIETDKDMRAGKPDAKRKGTTKAKSDVRTKPEPEISSSRSVPCEDSPNTDSKSKTKAKETSKPLESESVVPTDPRKQKEKVLENREKKKEREARENAELEEVRQREMFDRQIRDAEEKEKLPKIERKYRRRGSDGEMSDVSSDELHLEIKDDSVKEPEPEIPVALVEKKERTEPKSEGELSSTDEEEEAAVKEKSPEVALENISSEDSLEPEEIVLEAPAPKPKSHHLKRKSGGRKAREMAALAGDKVMEAKGGKAASPLRTVYEKTANEAESRPQEEKLETRTVSVTKKPSSPIRSDRQSKSRTSSKSPVRKSVTPKLDPVRPTDKIAAGEVAPDTAIPRKEISEKIGLLSKKPRMWSEDGRQPVPPGTEPPEPEEGELEEGELEDSPVKPVRTKDLPATSKFNLGESLEENELMRMSEKIKEPANREYSEERDIRRKRPVQREGARHDRSRERDRARDRSEDRGSRKRSAERDASRKRSRSPSRPSPPPTPEEEGPPPLPRYSPPPIPEEPPLPKVVVIARDDEAVRSRKQKQKEMEKLDKEIEKRQKEKKGTMSFEPPSMDVVNQIQNTAAIRLVFGQETAYNAIALQAQAHAAKNNPDYVPPVVPSTSADTAASTPATGVPGVPTLSVSAGVVPPGTVQLGVHVQPPIPGVVPNVPPPIIPVHSAAAPIMTPSLIPGFAPNQPPPDPNAPLSFKNTQQPYTIPPESKIDEGSKQKPKRKRTPEEIELRRAKRRSIMSQGLPGQMVSDSDSSSETESEHIDRSKPSGSLSQALNQIHASNQTSSGVNLTPAVGTFVSTASHPGLAPGAVPTDVRVPVPEQVIPGLGDFEPVVHNPPPNIAAARPPFLQNVPGIQRPIRPPIADVPRPQFAGIPPNLPLGGQNIIRPDLSNIRPIGLSTGSPAIAPGIPGVAPQNIPGVPRGLAPPMSGPRPAEPQLVASGPRPPFAGIPQPMRQPMPNVRPSMVPQVRPGAGPVLVPPGQNSSQLADNRFSSEVRPNMGRGQGMPGLGLAPGNAPRGPPPPMVNRPSGPPPQRPPRPQFEPDQSGGPGFHRPRFDEPHGQVRGRGMPPWNGRGRGRDGGPQPGVRPPAIPSLMDMDTAFSSPSNENTDDSEWMNPDDDFPRRKNLLSDLMAPSDEEFETMEHQHEEEMPFKPDHRNDHCGRPERREGGHNRGNFSNRGGMNRGRGFNPRGNRGRGMGGGRGSRRPNRGGM